VTKYQNMIFAAAVARTQRPLWNWCCCSYSLSNIISQMHRCRCPRCQMHRCPGAKCTGAPGAKCTGAPGSKCTGAPGAQVLCWTKCPVRRKKDHYVQTCFGVQCCQVQRCSDYMYSRPKMHAQLKRCAQVQTGWGASIVQRREVQKDAPFSDIFLTVKKNKCSINYLL